MGDPGEDLKLVDTTVPAVVAASLPVVPVALPVVPVALLVPMQPGVPALQGV